MKKTWLILGMAACLVGCSGKNVTPSPSAAPSETPTVEPTATPAPVLSQAPKKTLDELPLSKEYVDQMEGYEDIEIVLLGCTGPSRTVEDVLARAENDWGYKLISEIDDAHKIQGEDSVYGNLVYLVIPSRETKLTIASFDSQTALPKDIWYLEENSLPVLYIESADGMTPRGIFSYNTNYGDTAFLYTGVNADGHLRTDYKMGTVDMTPYDQLTSAEVPLLAQYLHDVMMNFAPQASEQLQTGQYTCSSMDEMLYEGNMYQMYSMDPKEEGLPQYIYGVHYDTLSNTLKYLESYDYSVWADPEQVQG